MFQTDNQEEKLTNFKIELDSKQNEKDLLMKEMESYVEDLKKNENEVLQIKLCHKNSLEKLDGTKTAFHTAELNLKDHNKNNF